MTDDLISLVVILLIMAGGYALGLLVSREDD